MTVSECTERELVARIRRHLQPPPDWLLVGIGDDAAVVEPERNRVEVLTVDAIVEGIHFDRAFVPPDAIGHRALAVNLSDLAAMGAAPRLALLSFVLPPSLPLIEFDAIAGGFAALARQHKLHLVGGNLTRSPGPLIIDVTVIGTVKRRQALTRGGARPGDHVYVTGRVGAAAAGLRLLRGSAEPGKLRSDVVTSMSDDSHLTAAYLRPEPRVRMGLLVSRNRSATACMDLSDGLADAVHQIAEASGVGITLDSAALPIDPVAREVFDTHGLDAVVEAITGGDDYELLITSRPRFERRLAAAARHGDVVLTRIGRCTAERSVVITAADGTLQPVPGGYGHFARLPLPTVANAEGVRSDA